MMTRIAVPEQRRDVCKWNRPQRHSVHDVEVVKTQVSEDVLLVLLVLLMLLILLLLLLLLLLVILLVFLILLLLLIIIIIIIHHHSSSFIILVLVLRLLFLFFLHLLSLLLIVIIHSCLLLLFLFMSLISSQTGGVRSQLKTTCASWFSGRSKMLRSDLVNVDLCYGEDVGYESLCCSYVGGEMRMAMISRRFDPVF